MRNRDLNHWLKWRLIQLLGGSLCLGGAVQFVASAQTNQAPTGAVPFQTGAVQGTSLQSATATATATNAPVQAQRPRGRGRGGATAGPPTLGVDQGFMELDTPDFNLKLVKAS